MTPAEQVKSRLDVVSLVGSYIKLDKAGVNFKARCPFHSEKTASFYVSPARETWHCFGCGKGGDVFTFVMEMDGLDFPEALKLLADRAGVEIRHESSGERSIRSRLCELLEEAARFFQENLEGEKEISAYLTRRGLRDDTIKTFRIGYAPDGWRVLSEHLKRKGYSDPEIEKAGLTVQGGRGPYDRFRSRIIFPLEDSLGRVVGFGGRIYPPDAKNEEGAKYINTPQTELYDKSRYLYGFSRAKNGIRREGNAVVVEGYMDCILSQQAGVENTVAVAGTALTESHLGMIHRLADALILAFDTDKAGFEASRRSVDLAHAQGFNVKLVEIEGGKDPADIVLKNPETWQKMVAGAKESIAFFLNKAVGSSLPQDPIAKKKIGDNVLPMVARLKNEIERAHWVRELAKILRVSEEALWRELERHVRTKTAASLPESELAAPSAPPEMSRKARLEEGIVGLLLLEPRLSALGDIPEKGDTALMATGELCDRLRAGGFHVIKEEFFVSLPEDLRREAERYLFEAEVVSEISPIPVEEEFTEMLRSWKELLIKEKLAALQEEIERLEALGRREETQIQMERFGELTKHLAHIGSLHAQANEKKGKKENF